MVDSRRIHGITQPLAALGELAPYARRLMKVDAAERAGDAATALAIMRAFPLAADGTPLWRSERVERLCQLEMFGPVLPAWVTSRWLVEQALLQVDDGRAVARAVRACEDVRGGPVGTTAEARARLMDHDWVWRQVFLYDAGRLRDFLQRYADPGLLARADRITHWCRARLGGYQLLERRADRVVWRDLATGAAIATPNIGSAALVLADECVIGRLVPVAAGRMFESVPLEVPAAVAKEVAQRPDDWVGVLREAREGGEELLTHSSSGFLTDVATPVAVLAVCGADDGERTPSRIAATLLDAVRAQLAVPEEDPDDLDRWACLAALLLQPLVFAALVDRAGSSEAALLSRLGERLAEPAATVCRALVAHAA